MPAALVTGGRRGIGRGIVYALADAGFDVVVNDLENDAAAAATVAEVCARGRRAAFLAGDIADVEQHTTLVDAAWDVFGGLHCLVNNAGVTVAQRGDLLDATVASFDRVLGVNLRGTFFLTQAMARRMVQAPNTDMPRTLITITSANATIASPDRAEYCLSKAGLSMMTRLFADRLAGHGIMVYEIRPGIIRTDMTAVAKEKYDHLIGAGLTPIARWGEPEDVGRAAAALATGALPFCTGDAVHIDGGLHIQKL